MLVTRSDPGRSLSFPWLMHVTSGPGSVHRLPWGGVATLSCHQPILATCIVSRIPICLLWKLWLRRPRVCLGSPVGHKHGCRQEAQPWVPSPGHRHHGTTRPPSFLGLSATTRSSRSPIPHGTHRLPWAWPVPPTRNGHLIFGVHLASSLEPLPTPLRHASWFTWTCCPGGRLQPHLPDVLEDGDRGPDPS